VVEGSAYGYVEGSHAALPDGSDAEAKVEARARVVRGAWLVARAMEAAGCAGSASVVVDVGAPDLAVSGAVLAAEAAAALAEAGAAAAGKGGKKGSGGKAAAKKGGKGDKGGKKPGKGGMGAASEAGDAEAARLKEGDDETPDAAGALRYDINAAQAAPVAGASAGSSAPAAGSGPGGRGGEAAAAVREVVGSHGLRRLLLRLCKALPVAALERPFVDAAGAEERSVASLDRAASGLALGMAPGAIGADGWTRPCGLSAEEIQAAVDAEAAAAAAAAAAAGEAGKTTENEDGVAGDTASAARPERQVSPLVDVSGMSSVSEVLRSVNGAKASGGNLVLKASGSTASDELFADLGVGVSAGILMLGSVSSSGVQAVLQRLRVLESEAASH
jgi:hypothetical protein